MFISAISTETSVHASTRGSGVPGTQVGAENLLSSNRPCAISALRTSIPHNNVGTMDSSSSLRLTGIHCAGTNPTSIKQLLSLTPWSTRHNQNKPPTDYDIEAAEDSDSPTITNLLIDDNIHSNSDLTEAELAEIREDREYFEALQKARSQLIDNLRFKLREIRRERAIRNGFITKNIPDTRQNRRNKGGNSKKCQDHKSETGKVDDAAARTTGDNAPRWHSFNDNNSAMSTTRPRGPVPGSVWVTPPATRFSAPSNETIAAAAAVALSKETHGPHPAHGADVPLCASPLSAEEEVERQMSQSQAQAHHQTEKLM